MNGAIMDGLVRLTTDWDKEMTAYLTLVVSSGPNCKKIWIPGFKSWDAGTPRSITVTPLSSLPVIRTSVGHLWNASTHFIGTSSQKTSLQAEERIRRRNKIFKL
ncbi:hypothetical protein Btru_000445 [Bulinus truncatus]|nr:hypothetical protein Btru_000445 [Bulinus truncatus]